MNRICVLMLWALPSLVFARGGVSYNYQMSFWDYLVLGVVSILVVPFIIKVYYGVIKHAITSIFSFIFGKSQQVTPPPVQSESVAVSQTPARPQTSVQPLPELIQGVQYSRLMRMVVIKQSEDGEFNRKYPDQWIIGFEDTFQKTLEKAYEFAKGKRALVEILPANSGLRPAPIQSFFIN